MDDTSVVSKYISYIPWISGAHDKLCGKKAKKERKGDGERREIKIRFQEKLILDIIPLSYIFSYYMTYTSCHCFSYFHIPVEYGRVHET